MSKSVTRLRSLRSCDGQAASPPNPRRPARGVCRLAPRRSPVLGRLNALSATCTVEDPGPWAGASDQHRLCRPSVVGPRRNVDAPEASRLGPPGRSAASPAKRHSPATAPRPASEDAVQTPLGMGRDNCVYNPNRNKSQEGRQAKSGEAANQSNFARTCAALSASARTVTARRPSSRRSFDSTSAWR
jgi:hypothetical protein